MLLLNWIFFFFHFFFHLVFFSALYIFLYVLFFLLSSHRAGRGWNIHVGYIKNARTHMGGGLGGGLEGKKSSNLISYNFIKLRKGCTYTCRHIYIWFSFTFSTLAPTLFTSQRTSVDFFSFIFFLRHYCLLLLLTLVAVVVAVNFLCCWWWWCAVEAPWWWWSCCCWFVFKKSSLKF